MRDIFLDRDGVINHNLSDHVKNWDEFKFLPGSLEALAQLSQAGYRIFVVTNQAIINRGVISEQTLAGIHEQMITAVTQAGGQIEAVLYCPHEAEENCECRKPRPGLFWRAEREFAARPAGSWLIGDHLNDIAAGQQAGCRTMLVLSGRGFSSYVDSEFGRKIPNTIVTPNLAKAVDLILRTDRLFSAIQTSASRLFTVPPINLVSFDSARQI